MERQINKAILIRTDGQLAIRNIANAYQPRGSQALIRVEYSAINPADLRHVHMGINPGVPGYEWVGAVNEGGSDSPFAQGQRVFGFAQVMAERPIHLGAHQDFLMAEADSTFALPDDLSPLVAVSTQMAVQTAADALFNCSGFAFQPANLTGEAALNQPILIWGAASALGQASIQLAHAAGFEPILTTASIKNNAMLTGLGAT